MDKVIEEYISVFGELPPADIVISYYDDIYQDLMKKAIKDNKKITRETLEKAIDPKKYDYVIDEDEIDEQQLKKYLNA